MMIPNGDQNGHANLPPRNGDQPGFSRPRTQNGDQNGFHHSETRSVTNLPGINMLLSGVPADASHSRSQEASSSRNYSRADVSREEFAPRQNNPPARSPQYHAQPPFARSSIEPRRQDPQSYSFGPPAPINPPLQVLTGQWAPVNPTAQYDEAAALTRHEQEPLRHYLPQTSASVSPRAQPLPSHRAPPMMLQNTFASSGPSLHSIGFPGRDEHAGNVPQFLAPNFSMQRPGGYSEPTSPAFASVQGNGDMEMTGDFHGDQRQRRRRGNLPRPVTDYLDSWFYNHLENPYPSEDEKQRFMQVTHLSMTQINNWFINARRRKGPVSLRNNQRALNDRERNNDSSYRNDANNNGATSSSGSL